MTGGLEGLRAPLGYAHGHSHVGSRALGEVRHRIVDVFLWWLFRDGLPGDFQLLSHLRIWLEFMVLF